MRILRRCVNLIAAVCLCMGVHILVARGQQPFVTDNADVTDKGKVHLEIANEVDRLQRSSTPLDYQSGFHTTIAYGIARDVEVSVTGLYLGLFSGQHPRVFGGISDTTLAVKYNFYKEQKTSSLPAFAVSAFVQLPTGSARRGLGSGVTDVGLNGIAQKTFRAKNVVRVNAGVFFAGNTLTGAIGFVVLRGQVYTGGASYVREISKKLQLGMEITGAVANNFQLSKGQLQGQFGGNYRVSKKTTFDFGLIAGKFSASPRLGLQLGLSHDF